MQNKMQWRFALVLVSSLLAMPGTGHAAPPRAIDLGSTHAFKQVPITVWLKMHDSASLQQKVQAQHTRGSGSYQRWDDSLARHAPTAAEAATVKSYLASRGLTVTGTGPHNLYLTAQGTAAQVQAAFKVQLHDFQSGGRTFSASTSKVSLPSHVQSLVAHVGGLTDHRATPMNVRPIDPDGKLAPPTPLAATPDGLVFSASCFRDPQTVNFSSADATATYSGNRYGQDITNSVRGTRAPCGYQPSDIQSAYHLGRLYRGGLDGTGQTVAIVDAFGSTTIAQDAAVFSAAMGLPPVDLTIIGTPTESNFSGDANSGWAAETTLDVEWVHAVAPGAKIVLVVTADNSFDNLFTGIITAATTPGVSVISNSWGSIEIGTTPEFRIAVDDIFSAINGLGVGVNFSSGDSGDEGANFPGYTSVDWPASSPQVTAVGGVSLALNKDKQIAFQTAWGNNLTEVADTIALGSPPIDPVNNLGFQFGSGGGVSDVYAKPFFQRGVSGKRRSVPDISWLADPYTGVEIIFTGDTAGHKFIEVIGGTSLACPMFSGLWAIAAQNAGHNLGQAAPYVYDLEDDEAVTDVTGVSSPDNVSGLIVDAGGNSPEVASDLASPLHNVPDFLSALYNSPHSTRWFVITFGTDSTLSAGPGYDTATGVGTPNPPEFVESVGRRHDD